MVTRNFKSSEPLFLESGEILGEFSLTYTTYGSLNAEGSNVIWVIHALTGDSKAADWWSGIIGEKAIYNFSNYFIICANLLGSCYGSTNALSENPKTGLPFFYDFPLITTRDLAVSLEMLRKHLQIDTIHTVIGGSLGGQVALEWAHQLGNKLKHAVIVAATAKTSPWVIGFNEAQRMAIASDNTWGKLQNDAGSKGLEAARAMAMLSYRNPRDLNSKQNESTEKLDGFLAASYLRYQGAKLAKRFHAFGYWALTKAMDSHDMGRGRGGFEKALGEISAKVLAVGVNSDLLFLSQEAQDLSKMVKNGHYSTLLSTAGHDAFLIEFEQLSKVIETFYQDLSD
ncbi:MAG: homoserine O-acetyltransferase [Bacteroidetes bacterium]|nr:homoserine O-acetyltransferase [Bacteroidota bacterium]